MHPDGVDGAGPSRAGEMLDPVHSGPGRHGSNLIGRVHPGDRFVEVDVPHRGIGVALGQANAREQRVRLAVVGMGCDERVGGGLRGGQPFLAEQVTDPGGLVGGNVPEVFGGATSGENVPPIAYSLKFSPRRFTR